MSRQVAIVEVAPRDGLQDEPGVVATDTKVELIEQVIAAGVTRVEATSFAHPTRVPQMADAEAVLAGLGPRPAVSISALVLNERGVERAIAAGVDEVNVVVITTDTFSERNQGMRTDEALSMWAAVAARATEAGLSATVTLAAAFGCPYEGRVDPARVVELAVRAADSGPAEICLADTIGAAVPTEVTALVRAVGERTALPLRCHLHNNRNTGYVNALAAIDAGAVALDASLGGIGGCPFAPGASGNVATEDLVHLLHRVGVDTGIDLEVLLGTSAWLADRLGRELPSQLPKSGPFP